MESNESLWKINWNEEEIEIERVRRDDLFLCVDKVVYFVKFRYLNCCFLMVICIMVWFFMFCGYCFDIFFYFNGYIFFFSVIV